MDPNNQPTNPIPSVPPTAPVPPTTPPPTPPIVQTPPQTPASPQPATPLTSTPPMGGTQPPKKSHKGLIIGLIIGGICLLIILALLFIFFVFIKGSQASTTSSLFMRAMTTGDVNTALTLTDGSDSTKTFLQGMAPGVKATRFSRVESTEKAGKSYYLYLLHGATNKKARTVLQKTDNKWLVIEFVAGENVALVGGSSSSADVKTQPQATSQPSSGQCLVQSDFDNWYSNLFAPGGKTATASGLHYENPNTPYSSNVHFEPDSTDTSTDITGAVKNMADLAKDPSVRGKEFTIRLYGGVATSQADKDFANKRAEKVKSELIANGVPADKIVIDPGTSATDYESNPNDVSKQMNRVVVLKFVSTCGASSGQR